MSVVCPICQDEFDGVRQLLKHYKIHESVLEEEEKGNEWQYIPFKDGDNKKKKTKRFICLLCFGTYQNKPIVENHIRAVHHKDKVYACKVCDKKFAHRGYRRVHTLGCQKKKEAQTVVKEVELFTVKGRGQYICNICKMRFSQRCNILDHVKEHSDQKYECGQCGKRFKKKVDAKTHLEEHITPIYYV